MGGGFCLWGFIDGTLKATCCPMVDQEELYPGHKRKHGFKYQSIETPDGLVSSLMGSFIGRRGDWEMVEYSSLADRLREVNGGRRPAHAIHLYAIQHIQLCIELWGLTKIIWESLVLRLKTSLTQSCHG